MSSANARVVPRHESPLSPSFAKVRRAVLPTTLLLAAIGCSASEEPLPEGTAGMAGVAGTGSPGGSGGSGNVAGMSGSTAGAGASTGGQSGGAAGGAAGAGAGGQSGGAAGGAMGGASGSGGSAGGASGGTSGSGGAGGSGGMSSVDPPKPSGGCNKDPGAVGSAGSPLTVSGHKYYVKLPTGYDSKKPYPVLFVFHPTNNPIDWAEKSAGFEQNAAKDAAIRVYPAAANNSSGWVANDVSFFAPLFEKVTGDYCVDTARAFATGESSGGDFSSILGCEHADKLRAVAPCATKNVPQYPLNADTRKCTGQVAAIVIHGKNDNVVGPENGPKTRDFYAALNHCEMMTTPVMGYTDSQSNCVAFQGCDAKYPVYWCQHTDPNYSNTNHGWPKFAANMIWQTVSKY